MKYGCIQCYWTGEFPDDCEGFPPNEFCCPDCGFPAYTAEEIIFKIATLVNIYVEMTEQLNDL